MNFYSLNINGKELKLRIAARDHQELEKLLGCTFLKAQTEENLSNIMNFATIVLFVALKPFKAEHGVYTRDQVSDLYDQLVDEGYSIEEFSMLINSIGEVSGFFPVGTVEQMKAEAEKAKQPTPEA